MLKYTFAMFAKFGMLIMLNKFSALSTVQHNSSESTISIFVNLLM